MKDHVKNKRHMREAQKQDPIHPMRHKAGTKPARKAKKFQEEISRKHSKEDLKEAGKHMMKYMR